MRLVSAVYVPLDRSEFSKVVIPVASKLAEASGASLVFVHALDHAGAVENMLEYLHLQREQAHHAILESLEGSPAEAISRTVFEHPRSLVVMPLRSGEEPGSARLGPVTLQVLKEARCPVVLVPPGGSWEDWKPERMLLPQDSTADCAAAIAPAAEIADRTKAQLTLLHVPRYRGFPFSEEKGALPVPRYQDHQPQHALAAWREEFIERFRELGHVTRDTRLELILRTGEPAGEILARSKENPTDLIVLPWYGNFDRAAILKAVLREASCPIMAVRIETRGRIEVAA